MSYTVYQQITPLEEFGFIAGNDFELVYDVFDDTGAPLNLNAMTLSVSISPYGQPNNVVLQKSGVADPDTVNHANRFSVELTNAETQTWSGKYVHQPHIVDFLGHVFIPAQGYITVAPQIS